MPNMDEVVRRFEEIKSYDDSWWLRYLSEKTIFDTDNIKAQKDFLVESLGLLIEEREQLKAENERQENRYQTFAKSAIQCANERDRYYAELSDANLEIQRLQKLENFVQLYKLNGASDIQEWLEEAEIDI